VTIEPLEPGVGRDFVRRSLAEDLGWGDATVQAVIPPDAVGQGVLLARAASVVAGLDLALEAFRQLDPSMCVRSQRAEGEWCQAGDELAVITGLAAPMLTAERTALNIVRHLSGIATVTRRYVEAANGRVVIADTRKTLPLLRPIQKYAVRVGGGENGRLALDEGVILKASHIRFAGGIKAAVTRARTAGTQTPVQVEISTVDQAIEALDAGAGVLLFTGSSGDELRDVVRRSRGRARVEVSGQIPIERLSQLASDGADFVSIGSLTDSAPASDFTFELRSF
jgi:nicotinate-nucleotide pyrophosphorylase (carboxylating)